MADNLPENGFTPDHPIGPNPFRKEDPRHEFWETASRTAREQHALFISSMLARMEVEKADINENPEGFHRWALDLHAGLFDIRASALSSTVWGYEGTARYEKSLRALVKFTLATAQNIRLPALQIRIAQQMEHWRAQGLRLARESEEAKGLHPKPNAAAPPGEATNATPTPRQPETVTIGDITAAVTPVQVEAAPLDPVASERQAMLAKYKSEVRKVTGKELRDVAIYGKLRHKDAKGQFISWKFNKADSKNSCAFDRSVRRMICEDKPHMKRE